MGRSLDGQYEFEDFYSGTVRRVTAQIFAMLGDLAESEDAVAEAYARAWQRWSSVSQMDDPTAWVRTVAYRLKVSAWRSATRRVTAHRQHGLPPPVPDLSPDHVALVEALRGIPVAQRQAIVLYHIAGLSIDEVAAETGVPAGTVKARLFRGRKALAERLGDPAPGETGLPATQSRRTLMGVTKDA